MLPHLKGCKLEFPGWFRRRKHAERKPHINLNEKVLQVNFFGCTLSGIFSLLAVLLPHGRITLWNLLPISYPIGSCQLFFANPVRNKWPSDWIQFSQLSGEMNLDMQSQRAATVGQSVLLCTEMDAHTITQNDRAYETKGHHPKQFFSALFGC